MIRLKSKARGRKSFWRIYKSSSNRKRATTMLKKHHPELNYLVEWNDVQGFGLQMTIVDWRP